MKTAIAIPTYDERENVRPAAEAVLAAMPDATLLFIDDNSPDGTGEVLDAMAAEDGRIRVLHRVRKEGLGRAYVAGFAEALASGAELVVQMDCDFSHDPTDVPRLVAACEAGAGLAIGSRYVRGGSTPGWPFRRRLISRLGGVVVRLATGMPVRDPTAGFKCWRAEALRAADFASAASAGYSFQMEMNHRAWRAGVAIREIPVVFRDRARGYSKISAGIAVESLKMAFRLRREGKTKKGMPRP